MFRSLSGESELALSCDEEEALEAEVTYSLFPLLFLFPFLPLWLCFSLCCFPEEEDFLAEDFLAGDLLLRSGVGGAGQAVVSALTAHFTTISHQRASQELAAMKGRTVCVKRLAHKHTSLSEFTSHYCQIWSTPHTVETHPHDA